MTPIKFIVSYYTGGVVQAGGFVNIHYDYSLLQYKLMCIMHGQY